MRAARDMCSRDRIHTQKQPPSGHGTGRRLCISVRSEAAFVSAGKRVCSRYLVKNRNQGIKKAHAPLTMRDMGLLTLYCRILPGAVRQRSGNILELCCCFDAFCQTVLIYFVERKVLNVNCLQIKKCFAFGFFRRDTLVFPRLMQTQ